MFQRVVGGPWGRIIRPVDAAAPVKPIDLIDGDSIKRDGIVCRIKGYDTPEIFRPRSRTDERREMLRGYQALHRFKHHISSARNLHLVLDKARGGGFGRDLVTLLVDGKDIAEIAKDEGWGRPWKKGQYIDWGADKPLGSPFPDDLPLAPEVVVMFGLNGARD